MLMGLPVLYYIAIFCIVIVPVVGSFRTKHLTQEFRLLLIFFWFDAVLELFQLKMAFLHVNNLWTSHIYHLVEFSVFVWVLSRWENNNAMKRMMWSVILAYAVFWAASKLTFEPIMKGGSATSVISHIFFVFFSLRLLHILGGGRGQILFSSRFWFLSGLLIYSSGDILIYGLRSTIDRMSMQSYDLIWQFHLLVNIISCVLFAASFLVSVESTNDNRMPEP